MEIVASFKHRVEQVFGALLGSSSASPLTGLGSTSSATPDVSAHSSWSVSDLAFPSSRGSRILDESSDSESEQPCAAHYEKFVRLATLGGRRRQPIDHDDLSAEENGVEGSRTAKRRKSEEMEAEIAAGLLRDDLDEEEECREMRLMVGMDDTLDFEEEEDEYDKVAVGREGAGERIYMNASSGVSCLPGFSPSNSDRIQFIRDSRANHAAAASRLEEDDRLAAMKSADVNKMLAVSSCSDSHLGKESLPIKEITLDLRPSLKKSFDAMDRVTVEEMEISKSTIVGERSGGGIACSIEREGEGGKAVATGDEQSRKPGNLVVDGNGTTKTERKVKKVRFAIDDEPSEEKETPISCIPVQSLAVVPLFKNRYRSVPDHVRNPSKYTHYTLDWSDEEEDHKSNFTAFRATLAAVTCLSSHKQEAKDTLEPPKFITSTPRIEGIASKSSGVVKPSVNTGFQQGRPLVSFAGEGLVENCSTMEETKTQIQAKTVRVFRKRAREE